MPNRLSGPYGFSKNERTDIVYIIAAVGFVFIGYFLQISYKTLGMNLTVSGIDILQILAALCVIGGLIVIIIQAPRLIRDMKSRGVLDKQMMEHAVDQEIKDIDL